MEELESRTQRAVTALNGFQQNVVASCALLSLSNKAPILASISYFLPCERLGTESAWMYLCK